jgi:hypothetical protein
LVNRVDYAAAFWFPVTPDRLWAVVERFDLFESWWGWRRKFEADQDALVDGNVLHGTVVPPVPYRFHLDVQLQRCHRPRLIEAAVRGTFTGGRCCG